MHSVVLISVEQKNRACRGPQTVLGYIEKRGWGVEGYCVSGSGYNEVLALEVLNVFDCVKRKRHAELLASHQLLAQSLQRCHSRRVCVCAYVHVVCVCVYVCVYVCL